MGTSRADDRRRRRRTILRTLGIRPSVRERVDAALDQAIMAAEAASPGHVTVLDAGCGRKSPVSRFRPRIASLVGVDIHAPEPPLPYLDEFARVDLCDPRATIERAPFDVVLSNFTIEHLADPATAFANIGRWLRPGGTFVGVTVNRRHPFVAMYLSTPEWLRRRMQRHLKAHAADTHELVGACNDARALRRALQAAGFGAIRLEMVGNLGNSWSRHLTTFVAGMVGDVIAQPFPSCRSTIIIVAARPSPATI